MIEPRSCHDIYGSAPSGPVFRRARERFSWRRACVPFTCGWLDRLRATANVLSEFGFLDRDDDADHGAAANVPIMDNARLLHFALGVS